MNVLNNLVYRNFPGNYFKCVKMFHLHTNNTKLTLSLPIKHETESVLVASINDYATSRIIEAYPSCIVEDEQMFIVRHKRNHANAVSYHRQFFLLYSF